MARPAIRPPKPPRSWPGSLMAGVVLELAQGRDTVAGLARRFGLPEAVIMAWAEPLERECLLGRRLTPVGSRLNGPC